MMTEEEVVKLIKSIEDNSCGAALALNLYNKNINDAQAQSLFKALTKNTSLRCLTLTNGEIRDAAAKDLANALGWNTTLQNLNLSDNEIGPVGAKDLAKALVQNTTLLSLELGGNQIRAAGAKDLAEAIGKNATLQSLDLQCNQIGVAGARDLAEALGKNTTLQSLVLNRNGIGAAGVKSLAGALGKNVTLHRLYLGGNLIGDEGAQDLAVALVQNTTLESLSLWGKVMQCGWNERDQWNNGLERTWDSGYVTEVASDEIGSSGAKSLAEALVQNTTLQNLDLRYNRIGNAGAKDLAEALTRNTTLLILSMLDNEVDPKIENSIAETLGNRRKQAGERGRKGLEEDLRQMTAFGTLEMNALLEHGIDDIPNKYQNCKRNGQKHLGCLKYSLQENSGYHDLEKQWKTKVADCELILPFFLAKACLQPLVSAGPLNLVGEYLGVDMKKKTGLK